MKRRPVIGLVDAMGLFKLRQLHLSRSKLKASSRTSALLSGFAMVAMVELQLDSTECTTICTGGALNGTVSDFMTGTRICKQTCSGPPDSLVTAFSVCTTLLVSVHLLALMISTCILPHLEAVADMMHVDTMVPGSQNIASQIEDSPHITLHRYIEAAWVFSTVLGIFLFLVDIGLLAWVRFMDSARMAAVGSMVILVPMVIVYTMFAVHFYWKLVAHKAENAGKTLEELERQFEYLQRDHQMVSQAHCGSTSSQRSVMEV